MVCVKSSLESPGSFGVDAAARWVEIKPRCSACRLVTKTREEEESHVEEAPRFHKG